MVKTTHLIGFPGTQFPLFFLYLVPTQSIHAITNIAFVTPFNNRTSTFVSGALHWLGCIREAEQDHYMILSFDVDNDKFGEIALPYKQQQLLPEGLMVKPKCLTVFKGKLTFITLDYLRINHINKDEYTDYRELTRIPNL